jgi:TolB-like protein/Flp pilus assembly protein TadD
VNVGEISFVPFRLDLERRQLFRDGNVVRLGSRALEILCALASAKGDIVSKDQLMAHVWPGRVVEENAIQVHVSALRKALSQTDNGTSYVVTVPGRGYRFITASTYSSDTSARSSELSLPEKPSIAVLPFDNLSGDREQEYFADGMAEEIITALSRCNWLFVISRNSSFTYKGKFADPQRVGRELGVRYVLQGSVRRSGNRLRFGGQLIDAISRAQIWAERFDGDTSDVFDLQDRFTQSVVAAIEPRLQFAEIERIQCKRIENLDAYDLLLRAQKLEYEFNEEGLDGALRCLNTALSIDSDYAPAMSLAALCYAERRIQGWAQDLNAEMTEGLRLASRAVELGYDDANVLWMCAWAYWRLGSNGQRTKELAYRAMQLNPNSAIVLATAGWVDVMMADSANGLTLLRRAERLSPRDPRGWFIATGVGLAHFVERRFDEAAVWAQRALTHNRRYTPAHRLLAASLTSLGDEEEAAKIIQEMLRIDPEFSISSLRNRIAFAKESFRIPYVEALCLAGLRN